MYYAACFGDSLIQGFPFGAKYSWTAAAEAAGRLRLLNYGLCGDCCDDILQRLQQTVLPEYVRHIVFLGGANDLLQMRPQRFILEDMDKTCRWCEERGYRLCIVLPLISSEPELNVHLTALRQAIQERFAQKALLLDLQPALGLTQKQRKQSYLDGVHPTAAAYKAMGMYAEPLLEQWLREGQLCEN